VLLGICFWREAPETAGGADRRAGKRGLDAPAAFEVVAVNGKRGEQDGLEVFGEQLEDEGILGFPALQSLVPGSEHAPHGREAVAGRWVLKLREEADFPSPPIPAEVPDGMVGMGGLPRLAQPVIRAIKPSRPRDALDALDALQRPGGGAGSGWGRLARARHTMKISKADSCSSPFWGNLPGIPANLAPPAQQNASR
jgi:hypothetical protein